jgi:transglutaminase-like putative cysteine protease
MLTKVAGNIGMARRQLSRMLQEASERMDVRAFALSIVPKHGEDQISAVYEYVKRTIRYQPDPAYNELFIAPHRMIELAKAGQAAGDCDDLALFCAALYRSLGYQSRIIIIDYGDGLGWRHAVCEVYSEKIREWIWIDTVTDDPKGMIPEYSRLMEVD